MRAYLFQSEPKILTQGDTEDARKRISDMNTVLKEMWKSARGLRILANTPWGEVAFVFWDKPLKEVKPTGPSFVSKLLLRLGKLMTKLAVKLHRFGGQTIDRSGMTEKI